MEPDTQEKKTMWERSRSGPPRPYELVLAALAFPLGMLFPLTQFEDLDDRNLEQSDRRIS